LPVLWIACQFLRAMLAVPRKPQRTGREFMEIGTPRILDGPPGFQIFAGPPISLNLLEA
jgi:hypothetical protein